MGMSERVASTVGVKIERRGDLSRERGGETVGGVEGAEGEGVALHKRHPLVPHHLGVQRPPAAVLIQNQSFVRKPFSAETIRERMRTSSSHSRELREHPSVMRAARENVLHRYGGRASHTDRPRGDKRAATVQAENHNTEGRCAGKRGGKRSADGLRGEDGQIENPGRLHHPSHSLSAFLHLHNPPPTQGTVQAEIFKPEER